MASMRGGQRRRQRVRMVRVLALQEVWQIAVTSHAAPRGPRGVQGALELAHLAEEARARHCLAALLACSLGATLVYPRVLGRLQTGMVRSSRRDPVSFCSHWLWDIPTPARTPLVLGLPTCLRGDQRAVGCVWCSRLVHSTRVLYGQRLIFP